MRSWRNDKLLMASYAGNALWFGSAFYYFCFKQHQIMRKFSNRRLSRDAVIRAVAEGDAWHHDIAAYLGGMNTSLALLAIVRIYAKCAQSKLFSSATGEDDAAMDRTALLVLGVGNLSQAFFNFWNGLRTGRWILGGGLDVITVFDTVFTMLDFALFWRL